MSDDSLNNIVVTILKQNKVCLHHEIGDRAWSTYKLESPSISKATAQLFSEKIIDRKVIESPYGKPFHFYFLVGTDTDEIDHIINCKLKLLWQHSKLTQEIGDFAENLIAKILKDLHYEEIETRKEKHGNIGLRRMDIDVFGKHVSGYYQNIEVKNRRQQVDTSDVDSVIAKTETAKARWKLPIKPALVCSFIYPKALKKANSMDIPVVITGKVFVPKKYADFYYEYSIALGSDYIEIADYENPPKYLVQLVENFIVDHKYYR